MISEFSEYLADLVDRGGPSPPEYAELSGRIDVLAQALRAGDVDPQSAAALVSHFDEEFRRETVHGHGLSKPFGYSGDFLMIDKIYLEVRTPHEPLSAWDDYFHSHAAPIAVRNRKGYFTTLLGRLTADRSRGLHVLNIGSGPGRGVREFLEASDRPAFFTCVDLDVRALKYAQRLLRHWAEQVDFVHTNALRWRPIRSYDVVWSAGLFDYLDDRAFVRLLSRMWSWVSVGGWVVVGNFSLENPSRSYMEILGDWHLVHRSPEDLRDLAASAGLPEDSITVESEDLGVNLFLCAQRKTAQGDPAF